MTHLYPRRGAVIWGRWLRNGPMAVCSPTVNRLATLQLYHTIRLGRMSTPQCYRSASLTRYRCRGTTKSSSTLTTIVHAQQGRIADTTLRSVMGLGCRFE